MATCRSCGTDNVEGAAFCDSCGIALAPGTGAQPLAASAQPPMARAGSACPACGSGVMPGEAFCDSCGALLNSPMPSGAAVQSAYAPTAQPAAYAPIGAPTLRATPAARVRLLIQPSGDEI